MRFINMINVVFRSWHNAVSKTSLIGELVTKETQSITLIKQVTPVTTEEDLFPDCWR